MSCRLLVEAELASEAIASGREGRNTQIYDDRMDAGVSARGRIDKDAEGEWTALPSLALTETEGVESMT